MVIVPLKTESFDAILLNCQKYAKEFIVQRLEYYDRDIYCWIKDELYIDFNLKKCDDVLSLIRDYIKYYNYERPMYCLKYKTPHQYKSDMGY